MCTKNNMTLLVLAAMIITRLIGSSRPRSRVEHCWGVECSQSNRRVSSTQMSKLGSPMADALRSKLRGEASSESEPSAKKARTDPALSAEEEYKAWKESGSQEKNELPAAPVPSPNQPAHGRSPSEKSWQKATFEKGMGMMTQGGIYVQGLGVSASMSYELDVWAVTFEQVEKIMKDEHERLEGNTKKEFEKKWANGQAGLGGVFGFVGGLFGFGASGGGGWENTTDKFEFQMDKTNKVNNMLNDIADLTESNMKLYGNVLIESKDDWPITVHAFVRVLHVEFTDDTGETKSLKIIDSSNTPGSVQAGDASGGVVGADVKNSTMNILPLK